MGNCIAVCNKPQKPFKLPQEITAEDTIAIEQQISNQTPLDSGQQLNNPAYAQLETNKQDPEENKSQPKNQSELVYSPGPSGRVLNQSKQQKSIMNSSKIRQPAKKKKTVTIQESKNDKSTSLSELVRNKENNSNKIYNGLTTEDQITNKPETSQKQQVGQIYSPNKNQSIQDVEDGSRKVLEGSNVHHHKSPLCQKADELPLKAKYEAGNRLIQTSFFRKTPIKLEKIELDNGCFYEGEWLQGMRHGKGTQTWADGSKYTGEWLKNRANGQGTLCHADGDRYEGNWIDDQANGFGIYYHANGAKYNGEWKDDKQEGEGIEEWPDGARYQGRYSNGSKNGQGLLKFLDGSYYKGEFLNNEIHGYGVYVWSQDRKYEGEWQHNKMHGKGKMMWSDGRKYQGQYFNDKKHGMGTFQWADGRKYVGSWLNGKQDGKGRYYNMQGESRAGEWSDGKRIRWLPQEEQKKGTSIAMQPKTVSV